MTYFAQIFTAYTLIGEGSFGKVFRARTRKDNKIYAVKRIKTCVSYNSRYTEIKNYENVGEHPNIVQFFMAWEENAEIFLLLECCDSSLADLSSYYHDIPEQFLLAVLLDIGRALQFLHERSLIHLDIKPGNIMIRDGHFKLADFGILRDLNAVSILCSCGKPKSLNSFSFWTCCYFCDLGLTP